MAKAQGKAFWLTSSTISSAQHERDCLYTVWLTALVLSGSQVITQVTRHSPFFCRQCTGVYDAARRCSTNSAPGQRHSFHSEWEAGWQAPEKAPAIIIQDTIQLFKASNREEVETKFEDWLTEGARSSYAKDVIAQVLNYSSSGNELGVAPCFGVKKNLACTKKLDTDPVMPKKIHHRITSEWEILRSKVLYLNRMNPDD